MPTLKEWNGSQWIEVQAPIPTHTHDESEIADLLTDLSGKAATAHAHVEGDITNLAADLALKIPLTQRAAANGVATLDASSLVPDAQIPAAIARDTEVTSAVAAEAVLRAAADALLIPLTQRAAASGVATLDANTLIPQAQIPLGYGFPYTVDPGLVRSSDQIAAVANQAIYARCLFGGTISKIGVSVTTQSGNICVAVHSNSGAGRSAVPGTRVATSGSVACPAVGYQEISLGGSVTLQPGDWLSIAADNATASFRSLLATAGDSNLGLGRQFRQATAFPIPSTPASLVATLGYTYVLVGVT